MNTIPRVHAAAAKHQRQVISASGMAGRRKIRRKPTPLEDGGFIAWTQPLALRGGVVRSSSLTLFPRNRLPVWCFLCGFPLCNSVCSVVDFKTLTTEDTEFHRETPLRFIALRC